MSFAPAEEGDVKDDGEDASVSITGGQAVQVGSGNVMHNTWTPKPPSDLAALSALSPHVAVARLQRLSHDDLVDLFARASPEDATAVLATFFDADEQAVIAILGDVNRRKATALVELLPGASLTLLPEAAEEIAREAASLKWAHAGVLECLVSGYSRRYGPGRIFWRSMLGALAVSGEIETYRANGDWLGHPISNQEDTPPSPSGTHGICQAFVGGKVYASKHGAFAVINGRFFEEEGGVDGWLGFPVTDVLEGVDGLVQRYEGGTIYFPSTRGTAPYGVRREVIQALSDLTFRPVSKEVATESSFGTSGSVQRFQLRQDADWLESAICASERYGAVLVKPKCWSHYYGLGAERSWLGFPTKNAYADPAVLALDFLLAIYPPHLIQGFEGGVMFLQPETVAVSNATLHGISALAFELADLELPAKLGWPVSDERPIGPGDSDRIQFFQNGNVTVRDGKREIWLRPRSK